MLCSHGAKNIADPAVWVAQAERSRGPAWGTTLVSRTTLNPEAKRPGRERLRWELFVNEVTRSASRETDDRSREAASAVLPPGPA